MDRSIEHPSGPQLQNPQNQIVINHEGPCVAREFLDSDCRNHILQKDPYPNPRLRDLPLEAVALPLPRCSLYGQSKVLSFSSSLNFWVLQQGPFKGTSAVALSSCRQDIRSSLRGTVLLKQAILFEQDCGVLQNRKWQPGPFRNIQ